MNIDPEQYMNARWEQAVKPHHLSSSADEGHTKTVVEVFRSRIIAVVMPDSEEEIAHALFTAALYGPEFIHFASDVLFQSGTGEAPTYDGDEMFEMFEDGVLGVDRGILQIIFTAEKNYMMVRPYHRGEDGTIFYLPEPPLQSIVATDGGDWMQAAFRGFAAAPELEQKSKVLSEALGISDFRRRAHNDCVFAKAVGPHSEMLLFGEEGAEEIIQNSMASTDEVEVVHLVSDEDGNFIDDGPDPNMN